MDLHRHSPLELYDYAVKADGQCENLKDCVAAADCKVQGDAVKGPREAKAHKVSECTLTGLARACI
jgi:hypothetical protein